MSRGYYPGLTPTEAMARVEEAIKPAYSELSKIAARYHPATETYWAFDRATKALNALAVRLTGDNLYPEFKPPSSK